MNDEVVRGSIILENGEIRWPPPAPVGPPTPPPAASPKPVQVIKEKEVSPLMATVKDSLICGAGNLLNSVYNLIEICTKSLIKPFSLRYWKHIRIRCDITESCIYDDVNNIWLSRNRWLSHSMGCHACFTFTINVCHECYFRNNGCRWIIANERRILSNKFC